jgi:excisionase family DNA binding protein
MRVPPGQLSLDLDTSPSAAPAAAPAPTQPPNSEQEAIRGLSPAVAGPSRLRACAVGAARIGVEGLLTVAEVAALTGLSPNAVYRAIWSGELRASKLRGRIRVPAYAVDAWVDNGRVEPRRLHRASAAPSPRARPVSHGRGLRELLEVATVPG